MPDPATAFIDPFCAVPTLSLTCTIAETGTKEAYNRDPRGIAQRGEKYLPVHRPGRHGGLRSGSGVLHLRQRPVSTTRPTAHFTRVDSEEADLEHRPRRNAQPRLQDSPQGRLFPGRAHRHPAGHPHRDVPGHGAAGHQIERQHHEVATAGQAEIDFRFDTLVKTADTMMLYKYVIKNVATRHGKTVTFMPKPLFGDNGSRHAHAPIALEEGQAALRRQRICRACRRWRFTTSAGILKHAKALCAICNPDHQLLQAPGARLRSAGEPGLQRAQSLRGHPHPDLQRESQSQAHRVSSAGSGRQSVSVLHRAADGRVWTGAEQD